MTSKLSSINRRDFLKLLGITSLSVLGSTVASALSTHFNLLNERKRNNPNVLVVVFDALSARNMSLYGYPRATTPNLERFANRSLVFHQHHAGGNFTSPGTASLLLGVYPWKHRSLQQRAQALDLYSNQNIFSLLPSNYFRFSYTQNPFAFTLLNQFRGHIDQLTRMSNLAEYNALYSEQYFQNDYYVATESEVVSLRQETHQSTSLLLSLLEEWQLKRDNARLEQEFHKVYPWGLVNCRTENPGTQCFELEKAIDWTIAQVQSSARPFFGYVHYFPPHSPYNPRSDFIQLFKDDLHIPKKPDFPGAGYSNYKALMRHRQHYDQFVAHSDSEFGRLIDRLESIGTLEDTVVIFTSDHGEFFERGILGHGTPALYEPILHIPLLISLPGQKNSLDVTTPTNAVDVLPTLLSLVGAATPAGVEGSIIPLDGSQPEIRDMYAVEAKGASKRGRLKPASFAFIRWPHKLIQYLGYSNIPDAYELFDLETDPEELNNLFTPDNPTSKALVDELQQKLSEVQ
jgi:arylsulfatase A-like enzyme